MAGIIAALIISGCGTSEQTNAVVADVNAADQRGWTALHEAAQKNQRERIDVLLDAGAAVDPTWFDGSTPLHMAVAYGDIATVRQLIQAGADVNHVSDDGRTAVLHAVLRQDATKLRALLDAGADPDGSAAAEHTPLMLATSYVRAHDVVALLLDRGASIEVRDAYGAPALHWAAMYGDERMLRLVINAGADVDAQTPEGVTALMHAAIRPGGEVLVQMLLDAGADPGLQTMDGETALSVATDAGNGETAQLLRNAR